MDLANAAIALAALVIAALTFLVSQRQGRKSAKHTEVERLRSEVAQLRIEVAQLRELESECQRERTRLEAARMELLEENREMRKKLGRSR